MGQCYNTTVINTSIDQAWATVRDFHSLAWAAPAVDVSNGARLPRFSLTPLSPRAAKPPDRRLFQ